MLIKILVDHRDGLTFEELRDHLEVNGYYIDGLILRKIVARLILNNTICKVPSKEKKKLLLILCREDV